MSGSTIRKLGRQIAEQRAQGGVTEVLRSEVAAAIEQAHAAGESYEQLAKAVGVTTQTLSNWRALRKQGRFEQVRVAAPPTPTVVVHGPSGLRIEGLSLDELAALWRRLS
jgi:hypothetical protein